MTLFPCRARCFLSRLVIESCKLGLKITAQHNIGTATRHIGSDGDDARPPRLSNNLCFLLVVLRVQHLVLDTRLLEVLREFLRGLNRRRTYQDRRFVLDNSAGLLDDRLELFLFRHEDQVVHVFTLHRDVGGNNHTLKAINLPELEGFVSAVPVMPLNLS